MSACLGNHLAKREKLMIQKIEGKTAEAMCYSRQNEMETGHQREVARS